MFKFVAYTAAATVIALAIAVGLFRLFLPRLPEYQAQIMGWASDAIGMQVQFSGMDARWGLRGPELEFYNAELIRDGTSIRVIAAEEVSVGVALMRLFVDRKLVVDRIVVRDTAIEVRQLEDGRFWLQGVPAEELLKIDTAGRGQLGNVEIIGENIELRFLQPRDQRPRFIQIPRVVLSQDDRKTTVDLTAELPEQLGRKLELSAFQFVTGANARQRWDVSLDVEALNLAETTEILDESARGFSAGIGDLELAMVIDDREIVNATADIAFVDVSISNGSAFEVDGRVEYNRYSGGWLVAAEGLSFTTVNGQWPETSVQLEASTTGEGAIAMLDARASYLALPDLNLFMPWLSSERRGEFSKLRPDGTLRNLAATISDVNTEAPTYDVSIELDNAGIASVGAWPGIRGFSGSLRADSAGGRLEIQSADPVTISSQVFLQPLVLDAAEGTVIWRVSNNRTTILSDSIRVRSDVISSESNIQVTLDGEGGAPNVDLVSTFSIPDLARAKRFIPTNLLKPKLYDWFQNALVSGSIPRGSARLYGPLDKFPFDGGEGRLLVQGNVRNAVFKYLPQWPAADLIDVDVVVNNARLYTERGRSANTGNRVVDAKVQIADLRNPVLTIDAFATGSLETVRQFVLQSPLARIFGGQLDRIKVDGDAAFDLDLEIPIRRAKDFEVTTRIRTNNGQMRVEGFPAPVTDLSGVVTITRDDIRSESLGGTFLGNAVDIDLRATPKDDGQFAAVASARGGMTAAALVTELGLPLENIVNGASGYELDLWFPRGGQETPAPLTFEISTALVGMGVALPEPFGKPADAAWPVSGNIRLANGGQRIDSEGEAGNDVAWQLAITRTDGGWDLDRGVLGLGQQAIAPADTRGLHIRGSTESLRLRDWFDLTRSGDAQLGAVDRIRSIDLEIGNLYLLGQHLVAHRVRVDRSARDWLVQFDGDDVVGSVFVPYDLTSDRAVVLDMERLRLPGDEQSPDTTDALPDPRRIPPISLTAADFALGNRYFGAVETELRRTDAGLETDSIVARDETFDIVGSGRWVADESDPAGHRTYMTATLTSKNVRTTMQRLDYNPGIVSDDMSILLDLSWSGGPRRDFLGELDGQVQARFGSGQLQEVEPGAGRVFGLMSVVALPRRLSLDFSDVFDRGFGFDNINGTFRLEDGQAYTCNLSLQGPAADIGIVGRAGLGDRDYEQSAVVSANFGSALPVVTAVVAGPQAAAAVFLFSQIFKKPLQEVGQVYYSIRGGWDDPVVQSTNAEGFARTGALAGCLADSE